MRHGFHAARISAVEVGVAHPLGNVVHGHRDVDAHEFVHGLRYHSRVVRDEHERQAGFVVQPFEDRIEFVLRFRVLSR